MLVLHISNDFCGSKVHSELMRCLDSKGLEQIVYNPVRSADLIGKNAFDGNHTKILYSNVIKPYHKFLYHVKLEHLYKDMVSQLDVSKISLTHAATLFSDGGLAYKLYKHHGIPYVVAVRNTDINAFLNLLPNTWWDGVQILLHAQRIFFISEGLKRKFENHFIIRMILNRIKHKILLMPNGIDNYYLNHIYRLRRFEHKVIYVGDFSNNKNVARLGRAVLNLRKEKGLEDTTLTIVGGGKNTTEIVENMIRSNPNAFIYLGKIFDKEKICEVFRQNSIFAMPSIHETFGLVYVEALSQNLPVLYTRNQGIDGLFHDSVGIAVNPLSISDITNGLRKLLTDKSYYSNTTVDFSIFSWNLISDNYLHYYKECLNH